MSSFTTDEICEMSGARQARLIREGAISPVDAVEASLDRIERLDSTLNAFCTLADEEAMEAAREAERAIEDGADVGPLHGVPVGIKDLIATKGIRSTFGSKLYGDFVPDRDSVVVERIRDAGGIVLGKTNVPEFGYQGITDNAVFGPTRNPWDPDRTPGGSSGGSGAALAAGMVPLALGSDGGGSIRIPSSFCGLYGMKASFGRVPLFPEHRDPELPGTNAWESVEHVGPMSRTVEDSALLLDVIAGPHHMDRHSLPDDGTDYLGAVREPDVDGLTVAYTPDWGYAAVDPSVREITAEAARIFEDELGCTVERATPVFPDPLDAFTAIVAQSTDLKELRKELHEHSGEMEPVLVDILETEWTATDFTEAYKVRQAVNVEMRRFTEEYDLVLTPTLAVPPFEVGSPGPTTIDGRRVELFHWLSFTFTINLTGQPAATVPAGWTDDDLPVGLQIVGGHLDDELVLEASAAYEEANPWYDRYFPTDA
ncbi:amidase [Halomarina pelagica]|uniref:amidase n=1 Tax=Halomarina pelagica TaxID=2961599 RepID=UPI0020C518CF|nr:amidase family protein [Halomarina sp. BND7]